MTTTTTTMDSSSSATTLVVAEWRDWTKTVSGRCLFGAQRRVCVAIDGRIYLHPDLYTALASSRNEEEEEEAFNECQHTPMASLGSPLWWLAGLGWGLLSLGSCVCVCGCGCVSIRTGTGLYDTYYSIMQRRRFLSVVYRTVCTSFCPPSKIHFDGPIYCCTDCTQLYSTILAVGASSNYY